MWSLLALLLMMMTGEGNDPPAKAVEAEPEAEQARSTAEQAPKPGSKVMIRPNQYLNFTSTAPVTPGTGFFYGDWLWGADGITGNWGGARNDLMKDGIFLVGEYTSMLQQNLTGGAEQAFFGAGVAQFELTLDAETLAEIPGGLFFMNYSYGSWYNAKFEPFGSFGAVGSRLGVNNNFPQSGAIDRGQIDQVYWQQRLFDDRFEIAFGKIDANVMFMSLEAAGGFMYGSSCVPPTAIQFLPSFPDAATGLQMQLELNEHITGAFGWWDGTNNAFDPATGEVGPATGDRGPKTFFDNDGNWFFVTQWTGQWGGESLQPGLVSGGAWVQTGTTVTQGNSPTGVDDVPGVYLQGQQTLWSPDLSIAQDGGGISLFARTDWSPKTRNAITWAVTGGISATGVIPGRTADALGLMATWSKFSDNPEIFQSTLADGRPGASGGSEVGIEAVYRFQVSPHLLIQPGIEWIRSPGGGDPAALGDAVVPYLVINIQF